MKNASTVLIVPDACTTEETQFGSYSLPFMICTASLRLTSAGAGGIGTNSHLALTDFRAVHKDNGKSSPWMTMMWQLECDGGTAALVRNTWSDTGDLCTDCPTGALCVDTLAAPVPKAGYWEDPAVNGTFLKCTPTEAWFVVGARVCLCPCLCLCLCLCWVAG